jgi:ubiquinone biosynthesis protein Coq4
MPDVKAKVGWRVIAQMETIAPDQTGKFVPGVQITFETASGLVGSIFVPASLYNPETVRRLIVEKVNLMASVHELKQE